MDKAGVFESPDFLAAQSQLEHAGRAWACRYSSSAEFEDAVIRARRRAGAFRAARRRYVLCASAVTGVLTLVAQLVDYVIR